VRWWRWRRNPLKRRLDVVEAWLILGAWLLATAGGLMAGLATGTMTADFLDRQRAERQPVRAVVLEEAKARVTTRDAGSATARVAVRWTGPDGTRHTGHTLVRPGTAPATRITVWTDGHGHLTTKPMSTTEAVLHTTATGTLAATGAVSVVLGGAWAVRVLMDRRRLRQWEQEWAQADTRWGGSTV
jgi:hypothetical protein